MRTFPLELLDGYRGFRGRAAQQGSYAHARLAVEGQKPETLVIACCDSRVTPELIFSADPGSLFVVRNVANLVPPCTTDGRNLSAAAAIEFAVLGLQVKHIVVLGHDRCGGIRALADSGPDRPKLSSDDFVGGWMDWLNQGSSSATEKDIDDPDRYRAWEEHGVRQSIENLKSFACVQQRLDKGDLTLHGAWFDIARGELWVMDGPTGEFHWTDGVDFR